MPYTYSKFVYLDTNILSRLCTKLEDYRPFFDYLSRHDLTIAISAGVAAELSQVTRKHKNLDLLLTTCPSALIKTGEMILKEEVKAYPNFREDSLILYPLNQFRGTNFLEDFLSNSKLAETRRIQLIFAERQESRHKQLKAKFPPSKSGKYTKEQAPEFVWNHTVQWLLSQHTSFMKQFTDKINDFKAKVFKSIQLRSYVLFYKYYLGGRTPKLSDFGDLFHLDYIPYCEMAILEKDLGETLRQIKAHRRMLKNIRIEKFNFINRLKE